MVKTEVFNNLPSEIQNEVNQLIKEGDQYYNTSNLNDASRCYNKVAYLLWTNDNFNHAAIYYLKAFDINKKLNQLI